MTKVNTRSLSFDVPSQVFFKNVEGKPVYLDFAELHPSVLGELFVGASLVLLNNAFNGGGKETAQDKRLANAMKRWDSWKRGEYRISERAPAMQTLMRECYVAEVLAKNPSSTEKHVEQKMKATVKAAFGEDANATFEAFMKATAKAMAGKPGEDRTEADIFALIEAKYMKQASELEASRAMAAKVDIDLTDIDI